MAQHTSPAAPPGGELPSPPAVTTLDPPALDERMDTQSVGLIVLSTDYTAERDFAAICPPGTVSAYANRIAYQNPTTRESLLATQPLLAEAARNILPGQPLTALVYACTSASAVLGDRVVATLSEARPGVPCVTPLSAARDAFTRLGARRVSVLTPYTPEVSEPVAQAFASSGVEVDRVCCLGMEDDMEMARVGLDTIVAAAVQTVTEAADALFVSCTALRSAAAAERIERVIGKPVVTSNQAMVWRTLRLAGVHRPVEGYGRLLRE